MSKPSVFVDTSGFKALVDSKDEFHMRIKPIWQHLSQEDIDLVTSNYILDESFTLIRDRCGVKIVEKFRDILAKSPNLKIIRVSLADEAKAWNWFTKDWSKLSFTDCVSFALMKRLSIKRVATFDNHFPRAGFKIEGLRLT